MNENDRKDIGVVDTTEEATAWDVETLAPLRGAELHQVSYVDLVIEGSFRHEWTGTVDALDYGFDLELGGGKHLACTYAVTDAFALDVKGAYLDVTTGPDPDSPGSDYADISKETERWKNHGLTRLSGVASVWSRWKEGFGPFKHEGWALVTLVLTGESRTAVVTLGDYENGTFVHDPSNIAVFFDLEEARAAGVPLPGDDDTFTPGS